MCTQERRVCTCSHLFAAAQQRRRINDNIYRQNVYRMSSSHPSFSFFVNAMLLLSRDEQCAECTPTRGCALKSGVCERAVTSLPQYKREAVNKRTASTESATVVQVQIRAPQQEKCALGSHEGRTYVPVVDVASSRPRGE